MRLITLFTVIYFSIIDNAATFYFVCPRQVHPIHVNEKLLSGKWFMIRSSNDYPFHERDDICTYDFQYETNCKMADFRFDYNEFGELCLW